MRKCSKCLELKELEDFNIRKGSKDGYNRQCKLCISIRSSNWVKNNKETISLSRDKRRDKLREYSRNWAKNNKDYIKNYKRKYSRSKRLIDRMKTDDVLNCRIKISKSIGSSIREYVNNNKSYKKDSNTVDILGCGYEEFKIYIESKFEPWMNWLNYGKYNGEFNFGWDFDHIIPVSSALTKEDVYRLNHYTNFQPLCSKVNRDIKRDKISYG